jgi:hypothetical protein
MFHYRRNDSLKIEFNVGTSLDALEKWYKLDPNLFRASPEEFKHMTYDKIESCNLEIGATF